MGDVSPSDRYRATLASGVTTEGRWADVVRALRSRMLKPSDVKMETMERVEARERAEKALEIKNGPKLCDTCAGSGEKVAHPHGRPEEVVCPDCEGFGGFCHGCNAPSPVPICPKCVPF